MALKHVGRIKKTKRKVVVAYRVVPNDADFASEGSSELLVPVTTKVQYCVVGYEQVREDR